MIRRIGRKIIKSIIFLLIFFALFIQVTNIMMGYSEITGSNFQQITGLWEEPTNSLDAVYIGASPTFTSWIAPLAWKKYGIAVRTFANNAQPFDAVQEFLELAREAQPNAVYMVAINGIYSRQDLTVESLHSTTDYFKPSVQKLNLISNLADDFKIGLRQEFELLFPLVRYHSKWCSLTHSSFHRQTTSIKGG